MLLPAPSSRAGVVAAFSVWTAGLQVRACYLCRHAYADSQAASAKLCVTLYNRTVAIAIAITVAARLLMSIFDLSLRGLSCH